MKLKVYLVRLAIGAGAFACGVGSINFGQYLNSIFQPEKDTAAAAAAAVCPATEQQTLFVPAGALLPPPAIADSEQSAPSEFDASGDYYIAGERPKGFKDFDGLSVLTVDYETQLEEYPYYAAIPPEGFAQSASGKHKFARISVGGIAKQLAFETEAKKGVSYKFVGKFLDEMKYDEAANANILIEGRLTKMRNGKKVAESEVRLAVDESCSC